MANTHILRIGEDGNPQSLITYDAQSHTCEVTAVGQWTDGLLTKHELVLLLPASWLYHSVTHVASKNLELLAKSVPFAIEEELSNDVEDNYFAFVLNADGSQSVAAIEKPYLDQVLAACQQQALSIKAIHSEVDWLPAAPQVITLWHDEHSALVRIGMETAVRIGHDQVAQLLPVYAQNMEQLVVNAGQDLSFNDLPVVTELDEARCVAHLLQHPAIDLYVDELKSGPTDERQSSWRLVPLLLAVLLLSWVVIQSIQWWSLSGDVQQLQQQQTELLQQAFSDAAGAELLDPFAAIQSRLQLQASANGGDSSLLLDAVEYLGQTNRQQPAVSIGGLRLVEQKMEIQITGPDMKAINDFHQALERHAFAYQVQIGVNELTEDNTFKSILTMVPR
ncbi:type II secretion system protein GspL [Marinicella meishanensis]|uniref:type II secretion system protein GspL n=1 Tax=Marinicella meishanensis TaxID=2873263 RepID=UPI001CBA9FC7|nr:type II secretion system protein GspL [Marinicella sp. NBU2979]